MIDRHVLQQTSKCSRAICIAGILLAPGHLRAEENTSAFSKEVYTFKTIDPVKLQADVYRHEDTVNRPTIVWLHGGALIMGNRGVPKQLLKLAEQERFVLVSLDYRLAPEAQLAEIIEDLKDGLKWVRESGPELFHADSSRTVVAGASAGGYLALMSGIRTNSPPSAIVSYWGFGDVDGDWTTKPSEAYRKGKLIDKEVAWSGVGKEVLTSTNKENGRGRATFFLYLKQTGQWINAVSGLDPNTDRDKLTPFCPIRNISPAYPPTLFLHGTADVDVPVEQSTGMARELERHGVAHELITIEGGGHSLWGGDRELIDQAFKRSTEYIREQLTK
ncbi:MAG: alpha/beta hydrolase [Planctomycetes bacterium]|nr:alpha/beta hydrolase [Planctomycetota bacterium]